MRLTEEQRYRLERAKDQAPSTNAFVWVIPLFLLACWLCKMEDGQQVAEQVNHQLAAVKVDLPEVQFVKQQQPAGQFDKYPNHDPVCGGDSFCFLGWRL